MDKGFNGAILFQSAKSVTPLGLKVLLGIRGGFGVVLFSIGILDQRSMLFISVCISFLRVFVFGRLCVLCCVWKLFVESKVTHWRM